MPAPGSALSLWSPPSPLAGAAEAQPACTFEQVTSEIFLYDIALDAFIQVTDTTTASSGSPSIDGTGSRIAFTSSADLTGGNADGSHEIFVATCVLAPSVTEIPTVSGWGLALTALLLLAAAGWQLRRTRRAAAG